MSEGAEWMEDNGELRVWGSGATFMGLDDRNGGPSERGSGVDGGQWGAKGWEDQGIKSSRVARRWRGSRLSSGGDRELHLWDWTTGTEDRVSEGAEWMEDNGDLGLAA